METHAQPPRGTVAGQQIQGGEPELAALVRLRGTPLIEALEQHQPGAAEHADATGAYAFAAAVALGLKRGQAELCRETARLHDVGKLYTPVALLSKRREELTDAERTELDGHWEAGARLALGAGIPDDICGWLMQTRERYDGHGPDGLSGNAIPIASRLARAGCACDAALAIPHAAGPRGRRLRAIEDLRAQAGRELDPDVVEALTGIIESAPG